MSKMLPKAMSYDKGKGLRHWPCVEWKEKSRMSILAIEIAVQFVGGANLLRHLLANLHVNLLTPVVIYVQ